MKIKKRSERTPRESAYIISVAMEELTKITDSVPLMSRYSFFDQKKFRKHGLNSIIGYICRHYDLSEDLIRDMGGWEKNKKDGEVQRFTFQAPR